MWTADRKKLAQALLKVAVDVFDLKAGSAAKGLVDALFLAESKAGPPPTAEEGARRLLARGVYAAAVRVIQRTARDAPLLAAEADPLEIEAACEGLAGGAALDLSPATFADPASWPAMGAVRAMFEGWLAACRVAEDRRPVLARAFVEALPQTLAAELRDRDREADYAALLKEVTRTSPLDPAAQRMVDWQAYRSRLVRGVTEPLRCIAPEKMRKPFSLTDLYVPLRAAVGDPFARTPERGGPKHEIVWLDEALYAWATRPAEDEADPVLVLSGEPGAGKSSTCKMLAARLAEQGRRVLLVPLAHVTIGRGAREALAEFHSDRAELGHDALAFPQDGGGEPLLLILDGLDELAKVGAGAATTLAGFVNDLCVELNRINRDRTRVRLLLAGRPGAAASLTGLAREDRNRLHVLRFRVIGQYYLRFEDQAFAVDQRDEWWRRYDPERGMPHALRTENARLDELTEQPLLNWLLAQVLAASPDFDLTGGIHGLYSRLFDLVLARAHRRAPDAPSAEPVDAIDADALSHLLEVVAVAAWQGGGDRAVPLEEVEKRLRAKGLADALKSLDGEDGTAVRVVLDSFFCRTHDRSRDRVMEFTHKSFGQFLVARRIARRVVDSAEDPKRLKPGRAIESLLAEWRDLCGSSLIDEPTLDFLRAEIAAQATRKGTPDLLRWRACLTALFAECVTEGMRLPAVERAREAERLVWNAEVALLAALNATVRATPEGADAPLIRIPPERAAHTLHRLFGPPSSWSAARRCAAAFDLTDADLTRAGLCDSDLTDAVLSGADLTGANLTYADLSRADLDGADLDGAKLEVANLTDANLTRANLTNAILTNANLTGANLTETNLTYADLAGAILTYANLTNANLTGANLTYVNLTGADLTGANLTGADLADADLAGADLTGAILTGAILTGAKNLPKRRKRVGPTTPRRRKVTA